MGGPSSSFQTANAWDRDRMGWKPAGKKHTISALNAEGSEVLGNIAPGSHELFEQEYVLRDWVTTGDALRIKLPGIPENEYQQYIWIENHQGYQNNGSRFDLFQ